MFGVLRLFYAPSCDCWHCHLTWINGFGPNLLCGSILVPNTWKSHSRHTWTNGRKYRRQICHDRKYEALSWKNTWLQPSVAIPSFYLERHRLMPPILNIIVSWMRPLPRPWSWSWTVLVILSNGSLSGSWLWYGPWSGGFIIRAVWSSSSDKSGLIIMLSPIPTVCTMLTDNYNMT